MDENTKGYVKGFKIRSGTDLRVNYLLSYNGWSTRFKGYDAAIRYWG